MTISYFRSTLYRVIVPNDDQPASQPTAPLLAIYMKDRSNFRIAKKKPHLTHPTALPFNDSTAADDGRKMSVDSVFNEYLIREVERNPLIYDYGHENYTNAQMKQQVWEHIADALMASVDAVKVRWKTLRDRYQRERRRLATEKARGRFVHSPFALFHAMHFLNKFIGDAPRMTKKAKQLQRRIASGNKQQRSSKYATLDGSKPNEFTSKDDILKVIHREIDMHDVNSNSFKSAKNEHPVQQLSSDSCLPSTSFASTVVLQTQIRSQLSAIDGSQSTACAQNIIPIEFVHHPQQQLPCVEHAVAQPQYPLNTAAVQRQQKDRMARHIGQPNEHTELAQQATENASINNEGKTARSTRERTQRILRKRKPNYSAFENDAIRSTHSDEMITFGVQSYGPMTEDALFAQSIGAKLSKISDGPEKDRLKMSILLCFINFSTSQKCEMQRMEADTSKADN
ncbi:Transcription factor Adf-1 [Toxocara canis]|uniref:Transcription factor Adf-1 n=2 Tax=Toxocara canis TaxID=6265 RepID=A0A0B2W201_TOXCA|nr:Transcription factor Adf-1 [Toxocara canis]